MLERSEVLFKKNKSLLTKSRIFDLFDHDVVVYVADAMIINQMMGGETSLIAIARHLKMTAAQLTLTLNKALFALNDDEITLRTAN